MSEWINSTITAIGGGVVVLIGILTVFKRVFVKLFEAGIEASFEKNFEKFKNKLYRTTKAYEILLDREMRFYGRLESIVAELVPLMHDLLYHLKNEGELNRDLQGEEFRECLIRYCQLVINLKNETLIHESYVPREIMQIFDNLVRRMQDDVKLWYNGERSLRDGKHNKIEYQQYEAVIKEVFILLAFGQAAIRRRLGGLSGEIDNRN